MTIECPFVSHISEVQPTAFGYFPEQFNAIGDGVVDDTLAFKVAAQASFDKRVPFNLYAGKKYRLTESVSFGFESTPGHVGINGNHASVIADHDEYAVLNFEGIENRAGVTIDRLKIAQVDGRKNYTGMFFARPDIPTQRSAGMAHIAFCDILGDFEHGCAELIEAEGLTFYTSKFFQTGDVGPVIAFRNSAVPGVVPPPHYNGSTQTLLRITNSGLLACINELNTDPVIFLDNVQDVSIDGGVQLEHNNINRPYGLVHFQGHAQGIIIDNPYLHKSRENMVTFGNPNATDLEAFRFDIRLTGNSGKTSANHIKYIGNNGRIYSGQMTTYGNVDLRGCMLLDNSYINLLTKDAEVLADQVMKGKITYCSGADLSSWKGTTNDQMIHEELV